MPKPPVSRYRAFEVVLDDCFKFTLTVRRAPQFMRFEVVETVDGKWLSLDALDQFEDTPERDNRIIVAEKGETNPVHIKFGGNRKHESGWYLWVKYTSVPDQPPDSTVRDIESWRNWCRAEQEKRRAKGAATVPQVPQG